jgi:hypothetical protein
VFELANFDSDVFESVGARVMFEIKVTERGELVFIYEDELRPLLGLGEAVVKRASHVEPIPAGTDAGLWMVDVQPFCQRFGLPPSRMLGAFATRHAALFAEKGFIEQQLFGQQLFGGA